MRDSITGYIPNMFGGLRDKYGGKGMNSKGRAGVEAASEGLDKLTGTVDRVMGQLQTNLEKQNFPVQLDKTVVKIGPVKLQGNVIDNNTDKEITIQRFSQGHLGRAMRQFENRARSRDGFSTTGPQRFGQHMHDKPLNQIIDMYNKLKNSNQLDRTFELKWGDKIKRWSTYTGSTGNNTLLKQDYHSGRFSGTMGKWYRD